MSKIAICVCSNSGLDYVDHPSDINILRSVVHFSDHQLYEDYIGISAQEFYNRIQQNPQDIPKTAYISVGKLTEIVDNLADKGYSDVIMIVISKELSGLYDFIASFSNYYEGSNQKNFIKIHPFNSCSVSYPQSYMTLEAYRLAKSGESVEYILNHLKKISENYSMFFTVDTLEYLLVNGRLSKTSSFVGNMISLRPLMKISEEGKVRPIEKIRTSKKAQRRILEVYFEETQNLEVVTFIAHANNELVAEEFKKKIKEVYPNRQIVVTYLTPVVGAHAGPGAISLGYIKILEASTGEKTGI